MSYEITCPYCFNDGGKRMTDEDVLFRSEYVSESECEALPDDYEDVEDFKRRYTGADKEEILQKLKDWEFFKEGKDEEYEKFWSRFGGTTEKNPADDVLKVMAYHRKVIDPNKPEHQRYLKKQADGTYFIRDRQGMVSQIELYNGEKCNRRVCRFCHNPLPEEYGKYPVKFASIIGITGAGKTVYLSQLLSKMKGYATKVGLTAVVSNPGVRVFLNNNKIAVGEYLPGSTPANRLQQPLFYEMVKDDPREGKVTETFVLYDVAGEVFAHDTSELVRKFSPFIEHSSGVIVLIDPMQFEVISGTSKKGQKLDDPTTALGTIHHLFAENDTHEKCKIPFAICISKSDMEEVQNVLSKNLSGMLLDDVVGIKKSNGLYETVFNAKAYAPIAKELNKFIMENEMELATMMQTNYASYAYFAITALGCPVEEVKMENGNSMYAPVGPILPKRVEEPLLWLFYRLGYIGKNATIPGEIICPSCGSFYTEELPEDERVLITYHKILKFWPKSKKFVNRYCTCCGYKWEHDYEE